MKTTKILALSVISIGLAAPAFADVIAFDMVGSDSQNLTDYINPYTDAFGSPGDGFQIYQQGVSGSIPFAVVDDSAGVFPPDGIGIIDSSNTDTFFGIVDTQNGDNNGPVTAEWIFDISGYSDLSMSIDMGAMGDFENSDNFIWNYSIDGGAQMTLFEGIVNDMITQDYTLESGSMFNLNDPMTVNGLSLSNELMNFEGALFGSGSSLSVFLTATANGGNEAVAFQNLIISGNSNAVSEPSTVLMLGLGMLLIGFSRRR